MCTDGGASCRHVFSAPALAYDLAAWPPPRSPLFHLYGDPPDDQAFDFIHIETISSRSSIHDWTIRAHRHRNLFQILLIERGGGEMTFEAATIAVRRAVRDPGAADHRARLSLPPGRHRRLGDELHRGRRRGDRRPPRRSAGAPQGAGGRSGGAAGRRRARSRCSALAAELHEEAVPGARRLSHRHARAAGADRGRGGAARGEPRARRHLTLDADRRDGRRVAQAGRGALPEGAPACRSMPTSSP